MTEAAETITLSKAEYEALVERIEDAEDRATIADLRNEPTISHENLMRIFAGESAVRVWREEQGLTQRALAAKAGISPGMLNEIEKGKKTPSLPTAKAIADAMGLDLDTLFG